MNITRFFVAVLLSLCPAISSSKTLEVVKDFAQFASDSSYTRLEMYYMIDDTSLGYSYNPAGYQAELYIKAKFFPTTGELITDEWILSDNIATKTSKNVRILIGQHSFYLKPGQYTMELEMKDLKDTTNTSKFKSHLVVRDFSKKRLAISDIEFCSTIASADTIKNFNPQFRKGSLYIAPNPVRIFAGAEPAVYAYSEIYHLKSFAPNGYTAIYTVFDGAKREIFSIPFERNVIGDAQVEKIELPLTALATGTYYLKIAAVAHASPDTVFSIGRFYLQSDIPAELSINYTEDEQFQMSEFATMTENQLKKDFDYIQYIATEAEKEQFRTLTTVSAKQKALFKFWKTRDEKPETPEIEVLAEFRKSIEYANKFYSNARIKEGWRTDRGRILLKYGKPTQTDRNSMSVDGRPYEVWLYPSIPGGGEFVFVDVQGYGNYVLVHSTAPGEVYQPNWMELYQKVRPNTKVD